MDRMRTRRPSMRPPPQPTATSTGPTYENFEPTTEWSKDSSNNNLLIHLPGFKREEISVQLDNNSGKIMVRGNRKVTEDKFFRLDQSFDVPENTIIEKISGRFENGYLTLTLPFRKPKNIHDADDQKIKSTSSTVQETHRGKSTDEDDGMPKKPDQNSEKKDEPMQKKKEEMHEDDDIRKKPENTEEKKDEPIQQETAKVIHNREELDTIQEQKKEHHDSDIDMEKKKKEFALNEMPKGISEVAKKAEGAMEKILKRVEDGVKKKEEFALNEMPKGISEAAKRAEGAMEKISNRVKEGVKKKEEFALNEMPKGISDMAKRAEGAMEKISNRVEEGVKKAKGSRKRGPFWRDVGGEDGNWLEFGSIDNLLEKVKRNKKAIAVAVVAFSVGFYVSHKMKITNGR